MRMAGWTLATLVPLLMGQYAAHAQAELFVAPGGSDENPGTIHEPFATPQRAAEAVRELKAVDGLPDGGVTVWLRGGTYFLDEPLSLDADHSGSDGSPVVFRARQGEEAVLSGGRLVPAEAFSPVTDETVLQRLVPEARGQVLEADLSALGVTNYLEDLPPRFRGFTNEHPMLLEVFCNGERMQLARWPNEGFAHFDEIVDFGSGLRDREGPERPGVFTYEGDRPERWRVEDGVWLQGYWARAYLCTAVKVGSIDTETGQITLAVPLHYGLDTWGAKRFFAFNLLEELDSPGEWYLDRRRGVLYFWPPAPPDESTIVVSMLTEPVVRMQDASHVTLRDLTIECGRQDAVSIKGGTGSRVVGCTIRNVGRHGVEIAGGTEHGVIGCDIHHTGYGGVRMSGGDRRTLAPAGHFAENNHVHHTSVIRRTHAGAIRLSGVGCRASHNLIHHEPHTAVWYRGNDHLMEFNEIYYTSTETTECGVFYTGRNWTYRGNVIRHNYVHHINDSLEGSPTSVNVVHLDDAVSGTTFEGNLCYLCGRGVSICGGPDNIVENNIFVDCKVGVSLGARGIQWWTYTRHEDGTVTAIDTRTGKPSDTLLGTLEEVPYQEPPWTKYPHMADFLAPERDPVGAPWFCRIERNISAGEGKFLTISNRVEDQWITVEDNWEDGDPGFVDMEGGDFHLREDAPVLEMGFEPIPLEEVGLYEDERRASWPVTPEPPPEGWRPRWMVLAEQERKMTAVPVFPVHRISGPIAIDGEVSQQEWNPNGRHREAQVIWGVDGEEVALPSRAWLEVDDEHLYVAFVNQVDPEHGPSDGHRWGQDDAVEIALAPVDGTQIGDILILRGYPNGHAESSDEAGAPRRLVEQAIRGVEYAAHSGRPDVWTAEWRIPFTSLGIAPREGAPRLLFNLSARKAASDIWAMWKRSGGYTWQVRRAGLLWLTPFGDIVFNGALPARARIDVQASTEGLTLEAGTGSAVATWAEPPGSRLTGDTEPLPADSWEEFEYSFVPQADGEVSVQLMAQGQLSATGDEHIPLWVYFDHVRAEGAELQNGSFEQRDDAGRVVAWANSDNGGWLVPDAESAFEGQCCVKVWHNGRFRQDLQVQAGVPVTIRAMVRAEPAP
ncbi:MAG: right-handed parallel beta-helix repeat-containing protein [Armatimonadota bacterium]|nr:right-handed parallel beta-helix repeat-containing protein [Armatimonadota bacterium]